jgi:hypothetical protein
MMSAPQDSLNPDLEYGDAPQGFMHVWISPVSRISTIGPSTVTVGWEDHPDDPALVTRIPIGTPFVAHGNGRCYLLIQLPDPSEYDSSLPTVDMDIIASAITAPAGVPA